MPWLRTWLSTYSLNSIYFLSTRPPQSFEFLSKTIVWTMDFPHISLSVSKLMLNAGWCFTSPSTITGTSSPNLAKNSFAPRVPACILCISLMRSPFLSRRGRWSNKARARTKVTHKAAKSFAASRLSRAWPLCFFFIMDVSHPFPQRSETFSLWAASATRMRRTSCHRSSTERQRLLSV